MRKAVIDLKNSLKDYFREKKIEYFAALPYAECREINKRIMDREDFTPRSVILYLLPYYTGETVNISRYAASLDYHLIIKEINEGLIRIIGEKYPDAHCRGYGDHSPIDERSAALACGFGILGDNGLIINEEYGSYIFIGDVVCDLDPELLGAITPKEIKRCVGCGACKAACPTGILRGEGCDCLSAITQKKGELSTDEVELMQRYNTVWGCDLFQTPCPYNRDPKMTPIEFFYRERIDELNSEVLENMSDDEFACRAFAWRKKATVERNISLVCK